MLSVVPVRLFIAVAVGLATPLVLQQAATEASTREGARPPAGIVAAVEARRPNRTSYCEFRVVHHASRRIQRLLRRGDTSNPHDVVPEWHPLGFDPRRSPVTEHFVLEVVGDTVRQEALGNEEGFRAIDYEDASALWDSEDGPTTRAPNQQPAIFRRYDQPQFALIYEGAAWSHEGDALTASVLPVESMARMGFPEAVLDLPALGSLPMLQTAGLKDDVDPALGIPGHHASLPWERARRNIHMEGDLHVETSTLEHMGKVYRLEWTTDHSKGGQPVRAALYEGDDALYSAVTALQQVGGRWLPATVDFFRHDFADGHKPYLSVNLDRVSSDEPWHRQEPFAPDDIGLVFGTQLSVGLPEYSEVVNKIRPAHSMNWDGARIVSADDYWAMIELYGMEPHPTIIEGLSEGTGWTAKQYLEWSKSRAPIFRKRWEKAYGPIDIPARDKKIDREGDWDRYVREFVAKHNLNEERTESAQQLLKHLKGLRDYHQDKYREALAKAEASGQKELAAKYREPVDKMFAALRRGLLRLIPPSERKRE